MVEKKYELRKRIKSVRWMIFWVVLAQFAAESVIEAVVSFMSNPPHQYIQIALIEIIAIGVPIVIYAKTSWNGKRVKEEFCLNFCSLYDILLAAFLGISGQFVMMLLNLPANYIINLFGGTSATDTVAVASKWSDVLLGTVCVVIIPAVLEEFWMRGIIFSAYTRSNTRAAVFFTALVFALLHLRLSEMLGFFFMGIMASLILLRSNSLYCSMIYHGFSNMTALIFGVYIMPAILDYIWVAFVLLVLGFILGLILLLKKKSQMPDNRFFGAGGIVLKGIFCVPVMLSVLVVIIKYFLLSMAR